MKFSYILSFHCPDKSGIQSKVSSLLFNNDAFLTDVQSYSDVESESFFSRIVFLVDSEGVISKISSDLKLLGQELNMEWSIDIEGRKVKTRRSPNTPIRAEKEEHEATHIPFRSWCPYCVKGRGRNTPHKQP